MPAIKQVTQSGSGSLWTTQKVIVRGADDKEFETIKDAKVLGALTVHKGLGADSEKWSLTHLHTGLRIATMPAEEEAQKIGELLWSKLCLLLRKTDKQEIRAVAPVWVKLWIVHCEKEGKFSDPILFQVQAQEDAK